MSGAVDIVLAFGAQHEAVQAARLPNRLETLAPAGEQFVNISLVADVEDKFVGWRIEDVVHGQGQFHDAKVRPKVATRLRERLNQSSRGSPEPAIPVLPTESFLMSAGDWMVSSNCPIE